MGTKVASEDLGKIVWDDELDSTVLAKEDESKKEDSTTESFLIPNKREYTKIEKAYLSRLSTRINNSKNGLKDSSHAEVAGLALSSGATIGSIGKVIGKLFEKERETSLTIDRKKISQNIVKDFGEMETIGKHLNTLIDNYDESNIGWWDSSSLVQGFSRQFGTGDERKRDAQDSSISAIETSLKKIAGYGANYSEKEQEMMRKFMPSISDGEQAYKNQVYNSAVNLREDLASRINVQDLAGYESNELKNVLKKMDLLIAKADNFRSGKKAEPSTAKPKKLRSLTKKSEPSTPKPTLINSSKALDDWLD